jgi:protein O-mannosyl-transferase
LLALMSKPMVVTLPVIMILFDYWPLRRFESKKGNLVLWQLKEKTPFFILSVVFTIITFFAQYKLYLECFPPGFRITRVLVSFVSYLEKIFWPHNLAVYYPFSNQVQVWQAIVAALLIIVISTAVIAAVKRLPYLFVGWLWYAITILPVIGIFQASAKAISDHYSYLPSIGITIMLAWGIPLLFPSEEIRKKILFPASVTVIVIMAVLTWHQCGYWKNCLTLYGHALKVTKDNAIAHNLLALKLDKDGNINEAMYHYNEAIRIIPDFSEVYFNKGNTYARLGQYQIAIDNYNESIRFKPYYAEAYNARGCAFADTGQYLKAMENFNEAIRLEKDYGDAYYNRGLTNTKLRQYQLAFEDFNESIRMKPNNSDAYYNRGVIYLNNGDIEFGCQDARKACNLGNCTLLESATGKGLCR